MFSAIAKATLARFLREDPDCVISTNQEETAKQKRTNKN
jgi:hypothetical protein